jgi:hypothetical protein
LPTEADEEIALQCITPPVIMGNTVAITAYISSTLRTLENLPMDKTGCAQAVQLRADLRKRLEAFEDQRKSAKQAVLAPFNEAEQRYNTQIKTPITLADQRLKAWIDTYREEIKAACRRELEDYFNELCSFWRIDFVTFEQTGITVDMATAQQKDPRKAKQAIQDFLSRIKSDLQTILTMENPEEVLAQYKQNLSLSAAIAEVNDRHTRINREAQSLEQLRADEIQKEENRKNLYTQAPQIIQPEERWEVSFSVTDTLPRLKDLKAFLEQNQYTYKEK